MLMTIDTGNNSINNTIETMLPAGPTSKVSSNKKFSNPWIDVFSADKRAVADSNGADKHVPSSILDVVVDAVDNKAISTLLVSMYWLIVFVVAASSELV